MTGGCGVTGGTGVGVAGSGTELFASGCREEGTMGLSTGGVSSAVVGSGVLIA